MAAYENFKNLRPAYSKIYASVAFLNIYLKKLETKEEKLKKQNSKLREIANIDPLTKLMNRRSFEGFF